MQHVRETRGVYTLREKNHLEDPGVDGSIIWNVSSGSWMWGRGLD